MAKDTTRGGRTETLTIRLDPKTRFVLEYVSRLKGQTITTVVERAIVAAAEQETLADENNGGRLDWRNFWNVSDGARALNLARRAEFFPTFEEERRLAFCEEHWPFFFINEHRRIVRPSYMNILWPRIDEYISIHDNIKVGGEYWAAGRAMQEALGKADLKAPDWPTKAPDKSPRTPLIKPSSDLDDDIPF